MVVKKYRKGNKTSIKADVIVLGCTLPGIVTANKLKNKFGDSMDIVLLDLAGVKRAVSKCNVAFQQGTKGEEENDSSGSDDNEDNDNTTKRTEPKTAQEYELKDIIFNSPLHMLIKYANEFQIPLPGVIINPTGYNSSLHKVFQYPNGKAVPDKSDFSHFNHLGFLERFELNQYQKVLDKNMQRLFHRNKFVDLQERSLLLYYDQTTMEKSICGALLFSTSREVMRTTVKLICGAPANRVSLLFYLHQCYRSSGSKHHIGGRNIRIREKLLGYCRKHLANQLLASIADITLPTKAIKNIRTRLKSNVEEVILETRMGETTYICKLLAMAIRPDQLQTIEVDNKLLPEKEATVTKGLIPGKAKKFLIQYEESFWASKGFSGDIFSLRGPIVWAIEKPSLSLTGSVEKYATIIGYLIVRDDEDLDDSRNAVVEQLTTLFGSEADSPVTYRESSVADIYIPRCGDYVTLKVLTNQVSPRGLEWGALDIFGEGDVASALQAGHSAYLHLLSCLRPQAQTYEDISTTEMPTLIAESSISWWFAHINLLSTIKLTAYLTVLVMGVKLIHLYTKRL